uniref:Uncharacterized protein n=1 Tax=Siphoviridae sp. ct0uL16 TaxID=2825299 RepID=A0A8S5Q651_9CAUD|nr:MAG TPA: hypothetical protein [Siphoviridae sp. ct0uL16]
MKTAIIIILAISLIVAIYEAIKYRMALTVLTAWCIENGYKTPQDSDVNRIADWLIKTLINQNNNK